MLATALLAVTLAEPAQPTHTEQSRAEALASTGAAHLELAATSAERPLDELHSAHTDFDAAFLTSGAATYLCSALGVADLALRTGGFADEQERMAWQETRQDDLDRLREEAARSGQANCRYDAQGSPVRPHVAILTDADFPPPLAPPISQPTNDEPTSAEVQPQPRRWTARTTAGTVFTGVGVGLVGVMAGAIGLRIRHAEKLRDIADDAEIAGELTDAQRGRAVQINADSRHARDVAIAVGVASAVSLATGVALLTSRKQAPRAIALAPYGGPLGGGAVLRLKF